MRGTRQVTVLALDHARCGGPPSPSSGLAANPGAATAPSSLRRWTGRWLPGWPLTGRLGRHDRTAGRRCPPSPRLIRRRRLRPSRPGAHDESSGTRGDWRLTLSCRSASSRTLDEVAFAGLTSVSAELCGHRWTGSCRSVRRTARGAAAPTLLSVATLAADPGAGRIAWYRRQVQSQAPRCGVTPLLGQRPQGPHDG